MIIPKVPSPGGPPTRAYSHALRKRATAAVSAFLVASLSPLAAATATTTAITNNQVASIFKLSPCGDKPGICP